MDLKCNPDLVNKRVKFASGEIFLTQTVPPNERILKNESHTFWEICKDEDIKKYISGFSFESESKAHEFLLKFF